MLLNQPANPPDPEPFRAGRFAVLRLAGATAEGTEPTRDDVDPDQADADALARKLLDLVADPLAREAIEVASGTLAGTIAKVERGQAVPRAKLRRAVLAASRYLLRMSGRPTPFGLFAGASLVQLEESTKARLGTGDVKRVRPDAGWLHAVLARLRRYPAVRERLVVTANNLCERRGDRLVLSYLRRTGESNDAPGRQLSIGLSPVVHHALESARRPVGYPALRDQLVAAFPEADVADADRLLGQLLDREILLTDLEASLDQDDPFALTLDRLSDLDPADVPEIAALREVADDLAAYAGSAPGSGRPAWQQAVSRMNDLHRADKPPIQVDLRVDADVRLPEAVTDEVAHVAGVLWRLAPPADRGPNLRTYQQEFLDRYGPHQVVPVMELLDPHLGLGPPAGYQQPPSERRADPKPLDPYPMRRDEALGTALAGVRDGELRLDDALVDELATDSDDLLPDSLDVCVQLFAAGADSVDAGDYTLAIAPGGGSLTAGAMCGRFAGMLDAEEQLAELYQPPGGDSPEHALGAQLFFQSAQPRFGNVLRTPRVLPYRVPVGCFDDMGDEHVLDVRDLAVGTTGDRLYLVAPKLGREVSVCRPHMLNIENAAPNLARFLVGVSGSGTRRWAPWLWGRLGVLPRLPRVRYGRTILSPALWRPDASLADRSLSWNEWRRALESWRSRLQVPDRVRVNEIDHHVELDLGVPMHQHLLRDHLRLNPTAPIWESPTSYGDLGLTGGRSNEVVVPILARTPRKVLPDNPTWHARESARPRHLPGGEWLYAKIYVLSDLHDALLSRQIRDLVGRMPEAVDRWFFLRYADPAGHLRLRLHGPADVLREEALPILSAWAEEAAAAGLIRTVVLDTYEPEAERYGGAAALPAAERLFHADSAVVVEQLASRAAGRLAVPIETLAAAGYVELLAGMAGPDSAWDWASWLLEAFPIEVSNEVPAGVRRDAAAWLDPERRWERFADVPGGAELLASWRERAAVAAAYGARLCLDADGPTRAEGSPAETAVLGVLHMHANRLIGVDRGAERRSYGILRAALRAYRDERRHHR